MTPELLADMRACAGYAKAMQLHHIHPEADGLTQCAARVLAWLDAQERMHTPIMPMDADDLDCEYTWLDFAGSV